MNFKFLLLKVVGAYFIVNLIDGAANGAPVQVHCTVVHGICDL